MRIDLALAGQEGENAACLRRERLAYCGRDRILDGDARRALGMPDLDRKAAPRAFDHRRATEQPGDPRAVDSGRHDDQPEVGPQGTLHVERQRQPEIAVEGALMEFVEENGGNPGEFGIVEDHARQNALGDDEDAGSRRCLALHAHGKADGFAGLLAEDFSHAAGGGAGGKPARFEQQNRAVAAPTG